MRLVLEAEDREGPLEPPVPQVRGNGLVLGALPSVLCWRGREGPRVQLMLLQARELGALVPGARMDPLPPGWLDSLDLAGLAQVLRGHPDFGPGCGVHGLAVQGPGAARRRGHGPWSGTLGAGALARLTGIGGWRISD
ncbi:MAG: hypothetical protein HY823_10795 [Acidobacteria bacterium]|nr:hypothetical protein [Acidobacteriota bacterium]